MDTDTTSHEIDGENSDKGVTTNVNENCGKGDTTAAYSNETDNKLDENRKLFVGGLRWDTSEQELRDHFEKFGKIKSISIITDPQTGRSRGFAFIVFTFPDTIEKVNAVEEHIIKNKKVDAKKAKTRHGKIFVGGLTNDISDDDIKQYFAQFGNIVDIELPFDKEKLQRKGYCFITFDSLHVVNELLKTPKQRICGKVVDVKPAIPKPEYLMVAMGGRRGGSRDARGGYGRVFNPQWPAQGGYRPYVGFGGAYDVGFGDNFSGGTYNGYDNGYIYGYGGGYDGGSVGIGPGVVGLRGGPRGPESYQMGKMRGTVRQPRLEPY